MGLYYTALKNLKCLSYVYVSVGLNTPACNGTSNLVKKALAGFQSNSKPICSNQSGKAAVVTL